MTINIANTGYEALSAGVLAAFFAQVIKFFIFTIKSKKVNFKIFTTTGGMPSSHSAGVMGLATSVGIITGFDSIVFAISIGFALIGLLIVETIGGLQWHFVGGSMSIPAIAVYSLTAFIPKDIVITVLAVLIAIPIRKGINNAGNR